MERHNLFIDIKTELYNNVKFPDSDSIAQDNAVLALSQPGYAIFWQRHEVYTLIALREQIWGKVHSAHSERYKGIFIAYLHLTSEYELA